MEMTLTRKPKSAGIQYGAAPRVYLLPPVERERRALAKLQRRWILGVLGVLAVVALALVVAIGTRVQAEMSLNSAEDQKDELQRQLAAYSNVSALVAERDGLVAKRAEALAGDMGWRQPFTLLTPALPAGATLTGFTAATGGPATTTEGELGLKAVATVQSAKPIDQAIILDQFARVEHVVDVDMLGLQKGENGYSYSIYVAFDQGLYNARFQTMPGSEAEK